MITYLQDIHIFNIQTTEGGYVSAINKIIIVERFCTHAAK